MISCSVFLEEAMLNMPWAAMSYGLNGKKYTVQHLNWPDNPKPYHYSAYRTYGRFGSFSAHELKKNETLQLSWRIIVQESEMLTRKALQKRYDQYASGVLDSK